MTKNTISSEIIEPKKKRGRKPKDEQPRTPKKRGRKPKIQKEVENKTE